MTSTWFLYLSAFTVISVSLSASLFLVFSDFIMRSLKLSAIPAGIEVMQIINREIWKSLTMILLWGNLLLTSGLAAYAYFYMTGPAIPLLILGAGLYVFGVYLVTFTTNVPMNNRLDRLAYASTEAATYWQTGYVSRWIFWNYIRAIATAGSAACFLVASLWLAQSLAI